MVMRHISKQLAHHPTAHVNIYMNGDIELVSYATVVVQAKRLESAKDKRMYCVYPTGKYCDGERIYTPTSAQQISSFLNEYFPELKYPQFKKTALAGNSYMIERLAEGVNLDYGW